MSLREQRLAYRWDNVRALWSDVHRRHIAPAEKGVLETVGAPIMTAAAGITKGVQAGIRDLFGLEAQRLPEGNLGYTEGGIASVMSDVRGCFTSLLQFKPMQAAGNALSGVLNAADALVVNPALDIASNAFGHTG